VLRGLEGRGVEEQLEAVPVFSEGLGALKAGAGIESVKGMWKESEVLKDVVKEVSDGGA